jgi:hypothetical protein
MKTRCISRRRHETGFALVVTILSITVMLVMFASLMYWAASNARLTLRNNIYTAAQGAAESGTENIMAYMIRDYTYGSLNPASSYNLAPPTTGWPVSYVFTDTNGNAANYATVTIGGLPTNAVALNSQFAGLYGFAQPVEVAVSATPQNVGQTITATVYQSMNFALIPLFQFAIFYNMDMEINPGAGMTVNGHVHSNNNIWATGAGTGSSALTFSNEVDAAGTISNTASPHDPRYPYRTGGLVYTTPGMPLADYASMNLPIGGTTNNNPTNVLGILNLPPAALAPPNYSAAYSTNGLVYLANAADIIITNAANGTNGTLGTNIIAYYQNPNNSPNYITQIPGDVLVSSNVTVSGSTRSTNMVYAYSWVTNATFYDYRESDQIQAVQVDVAKLNTWMASTNALGGATYNNMNTGGSTAKGHGINSIYVWNNVPVTSSQLPAVRMVNGQQLPPSGLTVATPMPIYVKGNYNTTTNGSAFSLNLGDVKNTAPAALIGDAITILSSNWADTNNATTPLGSRNPANTTINAATLEGIVQSDGNNYSGGVENFLRLLENWGGTVTYNGSIVVMFPSQYATNAWQNPGAYYNAPTRNWGFDVNFLNSGQLPPLTPTVKAIIRGNWASW